MAYIIFLSSFFLYLYSLAPSITVGDSGEFCASGVILGINHSPGYPLYTLLGKIVTIILPFGSYAFRINVMTAIFAAVTVAAIYLLLRIIVEKADEKMPQIQVEFLSILGAAFLALSGAFWRSSVQAEVFTLNSLFSVLILISFVAEKPLLMAFLFGLGLGNHHTLVFLGPLMLFSIIKNKIYSPKYWFVLAIIFLAGFSVYATLPIRSSKYPGFDWGHTESMKNLWRVITRADYGSLSLSIGEKLPRNFVNTFLHIKSFAAAVYSQFTLAGLLAGVAGWFYVVKNKSKYLRELFLVWLLLGPAFILLANMPFNGQTTGIMERFYVLVNVFWVISIAWGLRQLISYLKTAMTRFVALTAVTVMLLYSAVTNSQEFIWRDYFVEYDYGRNLLKTLPKGAVLFMDGGDDTFYSTGYFCFAEKMRQDIELHDRGGLVFKSVYGGDFRMIDKNMKEARRLFVEREMFNNGKKLYYSTFNESVIPGVEMVADGILFRPRQYGAMNSMELMSQRNIYEKKYADYRTRALIPLYPYFEGVYREDISYWGYIAKNWSDVLWVEPNIKIVLQKKGYNSFSKGQYKEAERAYREMLKIYPKDTDAMLNLGVVLEKINDIKGAETCYRNAIGVDSNKIDAYYNLSVLFWKQSRWEEVVNNLNKMKQINPEDPRMKKYLPLAEAKLRAK